MKIKTCLLLIFTSTLLMACKAEILEIDIKSKDVFSAVNGEEEVVEFEAKFSNFGELDEESRAQVEALENILVKFMEITDFELETTDMGYEVTLEGEMPITNQDLDTAYYVHVASSEIFDGFTFLELRTGSEFQNLSNQMSAINFMLSPDEFHPTKIKLRGKNVQVIIPATEIDGKSYLLYRGIVDGRISMKFPLVSIDMKEPSVNGRLVYFPVLLKSGFGDRMWSASSGGMVVASNTISDSPIATPTNNGVEVTFAWQMPESADSGSYMVAFHLIPQTALRIEANRTYDIVAGEGGGGSGSWYPAVEPLRTGGTNLLVDVDAKFDGDMVEREVKIEFDGAMSQWVRWGLDNIGNNSLSSNSWWRNLRTYSDSITNSEYNNGQVDDSEIAALNSHLVGSASDMKSFFANGLYLDAESILGVNPVNLGPTEITIDLGNTRAFSAESVTIRIDTSHKINAGERQQLIESFIRPSDDDLYTKVELDVQIRSTALQGLGGVAAEDIDAKHRRWIIFEIVTIEESELDTEESFRVEFVPTGGALYSPLVSAMVSVFMLVLALGLGMAMTRRRARVPTMLTVVVLGGLSLALYVLGLDMPFVLGVVSSSMLLVFPVALVSPRSDFSERRQKGTRANTHVNCPKCGVSNPVESDVRPLRLECTGCESTLRLE